jgi:hypothetical protein
VRGAIAILILAALASVVPAGALAQSAGDEQYTDPFAQQDPPAPRQDPPAEQPDAGAGEPAPGDNGSTEPAPAAEPAQTTSPTLPRTGAPVLLFGAAGYALLLAGIAIRRQT